MESISQLEKEHVKWNNDAHTYTTYLKLSPWPCMIKALSLEGEILYLVAFATRSEP